MIHVVPNMGQVFANTREFAIHLSLKFLVKQDCGKCRANNDTDCLECNTKYCNKESLVPKQCWGINGTICKTSFETPCFVERMKNNTGID